MAYIKSSLISRPMTSNLGVSEELGDFADKLKSGASSVIDLFGKGIKAQGASEALAAENAALAAQLAAKGGGGGGPGGDSISTPMIIGGIAVVGLLAFVLTRKPRQA